MDTVQILDCTLRDGGYINNWCFGKTSINFILSKLSEANIDFIEVGFIKGKDFDENRTVYPNCQSIRPVISPKNKGVKYVGMVDMSAPVPLSEITERTDDDIELIRVIFKQDRLEQGLEYIQKIQEKGYLTMAQLVSTDTYSDAELLDAIKELNRINPFAVYLVDSLGIIKNNEFLRLIYLMDHNLRPEICLGYHSHNNLQQAMGNAISFVNLNLKRKIIIDACVFGMGRGAGNLNEELFAEYLNENYDTKYKIDPMLEIIDECLVDIYKSNFWGYSLPFYLTAKNRVHPNYGKYYNAKGTLTEKAFDNLLKSIKPEDTHKYSAIKAEEYYQSFMKKKIEDSETIKKIQPLIEGKDILMICPGDNIMSYKETIEQYNVDHHNLVKISVAFIPSFLDVDFVFCSNMKRYRKIKEYSGLKIITSNVTHIPVSEPLILQYDKYLGTESLTYDNAGIMALSMISSFNPASVSIAGMEGYSKMIQFDLNRDVNDSEDNYVDTFNEQMKHELKAIRNKTQIKFITPSIYDEDK